MRTHQSRHRPSHRLVQRPPRGPMPDHDLFAEPTEPDLIQERFDTWIEQNPRVLADFVDLAREARAAGRARAGAKQICEVLRWRAYLRADTEGYALNNVFVSRLVRLAVEQNPDLEGLFEMRQLKSN